MDFTVQADISVDILRKWKDLARQLKKLWNMKLTVLLIDVGTLEAVPKNLEKRLGEVDIRWIIATNQTMALLKSARILRRDLETCGDLLSLVIYHQLKPVWWTRKEYLNSFKNKYPFIHHQSSYY